MAVNANEVLYLTSGLFKAVPSKAILTDLVKFNGNIDQLAATLGTSEFAINAFPFSNAGKAKLLAENLLGSTVADKAAAETALEGILNANGGNVGIAAAAGIRAILSDAAFADAKAQLENRVKVAAAYVDSNKGNEISTSILDAVTNDAATVTTAINSLTGTTGSNEAGVTRVLTTGQDVLTGTAGDDFFRAVAGANSGNQDQTTLNSSDIIDGAGGNDTLVVNMTGGGNYQGGARIKNIETLQIGTNLAAATFDYNVNQGSNEITEVTKIVADQINTGEILTVNNIVRTTLNDAKVLPTLSWINDSNTAVAGTVNYNYRAAELTGTTDVQRVELKSVNNGILNVAAGIETITLANTGTERVTLLKSANADTATNAVDADIISTGSLTRVNIEAAAEVGKVGGRVATTGLIDRVATDGVGAANTGTAANLLSVGARVTTVDASASTAAVNVQFVAKTDGAATNVTFTGGKGNDYVEFEIGNVNASGGEGNDTFAFVTTRNGVTNSTFGAGDTIVGGAGTDTIQLGDNGNAGTKAAVNGSVYTISDSEWANKTGVDVVDLRGATNTVTLSSTFVAAADTGVKLTVTTDNMVVGATATSNAEYNSINTVDLRLLNAGQGINFVGGQGSDRIILNDSTFTSSMTLAGGSNVDVTGNAVAGDYDTLTVSNSAVLDRTDLANVSGFEGLVLNKTVTGNVTTVIELTEAFLLANTVATDSATTSIDDRVFQIGTAAGANGTALTAGDTVRIDVTDLFTVNNNTVKTSVTGRQIDVTTLTAAGVTVQYVYNGTTYANLAALNTAFATVGGNAVLTGNNAAGQTGVVGSAVGLGTPNAGITFTSSAVAPQANVLGTNLNDIFNLSQADTVASGSGNDTVNVTAAVAPVVSLGAGANAGTNTQSAAEVAALAGAATPAARATLAASYADTVNISTAAPLVMDILTTDGAGSVANISVDMGAVNINGRLDGFDTVNVTANQTGLTLSNFTDTVTANAGGTFTLGNTAGTLTSTGAAATGVSFTGSGAFNYVVNGNAGADTITLTNTGTGVVSGGAGIDTINITGNTGVTTIVFNDGGAGAGISAAVDRDVVTGFSTVNDIIQLDTTQTTAGTLPGANAIVQAVGAAGAVAFNTAVADVLALNFDMGGASSVLGSDLTGAALLANLGGALTVAADGGVGYIVAYDNGNAYLYTATDTVDAGNLDVAAGEIALIGIFNGVAVGALAAANFTIGA